VLIKSACLSERLALNSGHIFKARKCVNKERERERERERETTQITVTEGEGQGILKGEVSLYC
jgi:hypothetical protein